LQYVQVKVDAIYKQIGSLTNTTAIPFHRASDWLLFNAKWAFFFSYIMARTSYIPM